MGKGAFPNSTDWFLLCIKFYCGTLHGGQGRWVGAQIPATSSFLFLSSMFLVNGFGILTQIDIFNVFFTLNGIKAMLRNQKKQFYIWFSLAVTFKMFGLFVAIPLILLKEKRVLYALRDMLCVSSLTLISKIVFYADKMKCPTTFDEKRFSVYFYRTAMNLGEGAVYFFFVAFIMVAVYAYLCDYERMKKDYKNQMIIWLSYLALAVILDVVAGGAFFLIRLLRNPPLCSMMMNLNYGIWGKIFGADMEGITLPELISQKGIDTNLAIGVLNSFFFAALVLLVVILRPQKETVACKDIKVEKSVLWMRLLANLCFILLPIGFLVLSR